VVVHFGVFSFVKHKGKFGAVHIVKAYRRVEYTLPLIFCLGCRCAEWSSSCPTCCTTV